MSELIDRIRTGMENNDPEETLNALDAYLEVTRSQVKFSAYLDDCEETAFMLRSRYNILRTASGLGNIDDEEKQREIFRIYREIAEMISERHLIESMEELDKQVNNAPVLKLDADFDSFTEEEFIELNNALREILPEEARVRLLGIKKGSVEVMLEISDEDMAKLLVAIKDEKFLDRFKISTIEFRSMKNIEKPVTREDNIRLLQKKIEKFRHDRILATDSATEFKLDERIKEMEKELEELKGN